MKITACLSLCQSLPFLELRIIQILYGTPSIALVKEMILFCPYILISSRPIHQLTLSPLCEHIQPTPYDHGISIHYRRIIVFSLHVDLVYLNKTATVSKMEAIFSILCLLP